MAIEHLRLQIKLGRAERAESFDSGELSDIVFVDGTPQAGAEFPGSDPGEVNVTDTDAFNVERCRLTSVEADHVIVRYTQTGTICRNICNGALERSIGCVNLGWGSAFVAVSSPAIVQCKIHSCKIYETLNLVCGP